MAPPANSLVPPLTVSKATARRMWMHAQGLDALAPFGAGAAATVAAIEHLGYVQIDTIHVIERCHHHILWSRIPEYQRRHLHTAQTVDKTVFEYWTHALSYVPTRDLRFFLPAMRRHRLHPRSWFANVSKQDLSKVLSRIRQGGSLSIRDIEDDVLVEPDHAWAGRKPSRRALQLAFHSGALTISERVGMVKTYELIERHFGWDTRPKAASERQVLEYLLDRALRSQGLVSLDSICHLDAGRKGAVRAVIEARVRRKALVPLRIEGAEKVAHWAASDVVSAALDAPTDTAGAPLVHILSPFDPLIIQPKRLALLFDYEHRFEAYVPKEKRVVGYFALPVLVGDDIVAAIDMKTDRVARQLRIQQWTWVGRGTSRRPKAVIEDALHRFEKFQLPD